MSHETTSIYKLPRVEVCVPNTQTFTRVQGVLGDHPGFRVRHVSITDAEAKIVAAPGNSFGEMNGGADGIINTYLSAYSPEKRIGELVKDRIATEYSGELPVGSHVLVYVPGRHPTKDWLVYAPSMRVAEDVSKGINAYLAFRSVLLACSCLCVPGKPHKLYDSVACPLFCTGAGGMDVERACRQMREAYDSVHTRSLIGKDWQAYHTHHRMLGSL